MTWAVSNFEKIKDNLKNLKFSKNKIIKLSNNFIWGERFLKTFDDTQLVIKKIKRFKNGLKAKEKVQEILKVFENNLEQKIEKINTMWDIVWNANPENVQRMVKNWSFSQLKTYEKQNLDTLTPYLNLPLKSIIWIQVALSYESTSKIANQICVLFKHIDKWVNGYFHDFNFYAEVEVRLTNIKSLLISDFGITINDSIEEFLLKSQARIEQLHPMDVAYNVIESLTKKQKTLDELLRLENQKIFERLLIAKEKVIANLNADEKKVYAEFNILFGENGDFLTNEFIEQMMVENKINNLKEISDFELIKLINKKVIADAQKRRNSLEQLFEFERFIQAPRFKLNKSNQKIIIEDDFDTLILEKAILK